MLSMGWEWPVPPGPVATLAGLAAGVGLSGAADRAQAHAVQMSAAAAAHVLGESHSWLSS